MLNYEKLAIMAAREALGPVHTKVCTLLVNQDVNIPSAAKQQAGLIGQKCCCVCGLLTRKSANLVSAITEKILISPS